MKIGIKMRIEYSDEPEIIEKPFQALLAKISTGADPDYESWLWHSGKINSNLASYKNSTVDELLELGRRTGELEKREEIYHEAHEIIHNDYPAIFLASACEFIGSNYRFNNAEFPSTLYFLTGMKDWQIINGERRDTVRKSRRAANTTS